MNKRTGIIFLTFGDVLFDQRMQRTWESLHEAGYSITVFARRLFEECPMSPYEVKRYKPFFRKGIAAYIEYNMRAFLFLLFNRTKVIAGIDLDTLPSAIVAGWIRGIPVVYDAHEYYVESPELVGRPFVKKVWEKIADLCIPRTTLSYTVGRAIADEMGRRYGIGFEVIRNVPKVRKVEMHKTGVMDPARLQPYIIYQGALNVGRGLESLIEAMASFPSLRLVLAGRGDLDDKLRTMVRELDLHNVHFTGNLSPDELFFWTKEAWLGINILENLGRSYYLSLSNKFFDYIQAYLPQICIDFPEYRSLNEQYDVAVMAKSCSGEELTDLIGMLLKDESLYQRLRSNTLRAADELNWENESVRLVALYRDILHR